MNRTFVIIISLLFVTITPFAQTQHGYVKTLGRPGRAGIPLGGVTVRVKGEHNAALSHDDGTFSFVLAGRKNGDAYVLQQVRKQGYELNNQGVIGIQYAFSDKVPLILVMVNTAQLLGDKQRIENTAFQVAERNYKQKLALLEWQLSEQRITAEVYRVQLRQLQKNFENYQSLIDGLAEHYAHVDYDNLDEKDREINICIEIGDLERADSLLSTVFDPVGVLKYSKDALSRTEQQKVVGHHMLVQANADMAAVLKQQERDAEHLFQLYTIALSRFDNSKARQYIETRAAMDTMNVRWQIDAGGFLLYLGKYKESIQYFERGFTSKSDSLEKAYCYFNIGRNNIALGKKQKTEEYFKKAIEISNKNSVKSQALPPLCNLELGESAYTQKSYVEAYNYFEKSEKVFNQLNGYQKDDAVALLGMAKAKVMLGAYSESMNLTLRALDIINKNEIVASAYIASAYATIGVVYYGMGDIKLSEEYLRKALAINKKIYGNCHPEIAKNLNNIGVLLIEKDTTMAINCFTEAIGICTFLYGNVYPFLTNCYINLGRVYKKEGDIKKAIEYYEKSLSLSIYLYGETHQSLSTTYDVLGVAYCECSDYVKSLDCLKKALNLYEKYLPSNHHNITTVKKNISFVKSNIRDNIQSLLGELLNYMPKDNRGDVINFANKICVVADLYALIDMHQDAYELYESAIKTLTYVYDDFGKIYSFQHGVLLGKVYNELHKEALVLYKTKELEFYEKKKKEICQELYNSSFYENNYFLSFSKRSNPQVLALCEMVAAEGYGENSIEHLSVLLRLGCLLFEKGDAIHAQEAFLRAQKIIHIMPNDLNRKISLYDSDEMMRTRKGIIDMYYYLASIEESKGNYTVAIAYLKESLYHYNLYVVTDLDDVAKRFLELLISQLEQNGDFESSHSATIIQTVEDVQDYIKSFKESAEGKNSVTSQKIMYVGLLTCYEFLDEMIKEDKIKGDLEVMQSKLSEIRKQIEYTFE